MYIYIGRRFKRNLWLNTDKLLLLKGKKFCIVHISFFLKNSKIYI